MDFLIGHSVKVFYSTNRCQQRVEGEVVYETLKMYWIDTGKKVVKIEKNSSIIQGTNFILDNSNRLLKKPLNKLKFTVLTYETNLS